jgi:chitinase
MWGRNAINNDFTMQDYLGAQPDRAFKNIKDVITILRYHMDATVTQRLVDQKNRVGNMMNRLETVPISQVQVSEKGRNLGWWQPVGLQNRWNTWIRGRANKARVKAETYIETYLERLKDGYASEVQRQVARDVDPSDPLIIAARTLIAKIDALDNEWQTNRSRWQNPF